MREVILAGASWCDECNEMRAWFDDLTLPGVTLTYTDMGGINDDDYAILAGLTSLPVVLFMEDDFLIQTISGKINQSELEHAIESLWVEDYCEERLSA